MFPGDQSLEVIGTYDPIIFTESYTPQYHLKAFEQIAAANGMTVASPTETMDLSKCGIEHNCCVDQTLIKTIIGYEAFKEIVINWQTDCLPQAPASAPPHNRME